MSKIIHILGSSGFIGNAIESQIGYRTNIKLWGSSSRNLFNLYDPSSWEELIAECPKRLVLLSWPGLPRYNEHFHITKNLRYAVKFIDAISEVVDHIVVSGTCYEYGSQSGELFEDDQCSPSTFYGISKNSFRQYLEIKSKQNNFSFSWGRIFFPYGYKQNSSSLFPSLFKAIKERDNFFNMGSGDQVRDFIHVDEVARVLLYLAESKNQNGIYNVGSGKKCKLKDLVDKIIYKTSSNLKINYNAFKDRSSEPKEFWANTDKLEASGFKLKQIDTVDSIIYEFYNQN